MECVRRVESRRLFGRVFNGLRFGLGLRKVLRSFRSVSGEVIKQSLEPGLLGPLAGNVGWQSGAGDQCLDSHGFIGLNANVVGLVVVASADVHVA